MVLQEAAALAVATSPEKIYNLQMESEIQMNSFKNSSKRAHETFRVCKLMHSCWRYHNGS